MNNDIRLDKLFINQFCFMNRKTKGSYLDQNIPFELISRNPLYVFVTCKDAHQARDKERT